VAMANLKTQASRHHQILVLILGKMESCEVANLGNRASQVEAFQAKVACQAKEVQASLETQVRVELQEVRVELQAMVELQELEEVAQSWPSQKEARHLEVVVGSLFAA